MLHESQNMPFACTILVTNSRCSQSALQHANRASHISRSCSNSCSDCNNKSSWIYDVIDLAFWVLLPNFQLEISFVMGLQGGPIYNALREPTPSGAFSTDLDNPLRCLGELRTVMYTLSEISLASLSVKHHAPHSCRHNWRVCTSWANLAEPLGEEQSGHYWQNWIVSLQIFTLS